MASLKTRLADELVAKKIVTKEQLDTAVHDADRDHVHFARLLIERDLLTEDKLFAVLAAELKIPTISLAKYRIDPELIKLVPERLARLYTVMPISRFGDHMVIAMADPLDLSALDDLKAITHAQVDPVLAHASEIRRALDQAYGGGITGGNGLAELGTEEGTGQFVPTPEGGESLDSVVQLSAASADEAPVVKMVNLLVKESLTRRASDIHLEPLEDHLRIRYRVDGRLVEVHQVPKNLQNAILTRLKILSGMDITEWRLPQDGRFKVRMDGKEVDFRVSVLPISHGGKVVMRVLDKGNLSIGLDNLGFLPDSIEAFKEAVKRPHGMILVTGPTGSGKSTTLYSVLTQLNQPGRNIITIEDPVEYQVEGITQVQANSEIGLTFAIGLRALLRQNPDIVMLGEIRDFETADIAMKASLTGHLVLSTLHTNDAPSAITRLVDMGVEPFLVASSITLIEAQRLVRKLCVKCRKLIEPPADLLKRLGATAKKNATYYQPAGCRNCNNTGYKGRMGIIEVILVDEQIRSLVVSKAQSWQIKDYAIEHLGFRTLREDGLEKAAIGITSLEEVLQATSEE